MSSIMSILICMLLVLIIVLTAIFINNSLNNLPNMIVKVLKEDVNNKESYGPTPNLSWNQAASFTNMENGLLTTAQNKVYKTEEPGYLPSTNTKGVLSMNPIASQKSQMTLVDKNDVNGVRNDIKFGGPINATTLRAKNTENNKIQIEGADIKDDKVVHDPESAVVVQKDNIAKAEEGKDMGDIQFSTNSRQNATAATDILTPSTNATQEQFRRSFNKTFKVGKL